MLADRVRELGGPLPSSASETIRRYRLMMWGLVFLSIPLLGLSIAGTRGRVPTLVGFFSTLGFLVAIGCASLLGLRGNRQARAERELESGRAMIVMLAAQLGRRDDAALAQLAAGTGPAAEAAGLILGERERKRASVAQPAVEG